MHHKNDSFIKINMTVSQTINDLYRPEITETPQTATVKIL